MKITRSEIFVVGYNSHISVDWFWFNPGTPQKTLLKRYAKQLEADSLFHKASNIYLSIYRVYDAINMLANNSLYKW